MNEVIHSFPPIASPDSRILVLGTMPGIKSLDAGQYYAHRGNHFWKLMFGLFGRPLSLDYDERQKLLLDHLIALWDVLQFCERKDTAADSAIKNEFANDFAGFYKAQPNIRSVFFNGKNAAEFYDIHVGRRPDIQYHILPSTSSANSWSTFDEKKEKWSVLTKALNLN